jgi:hypothetical protein
VLGEWIKGRKEELGGTSPQDPHDRLAVLNHVKTDGVNRGTERGQHLQQTAGNIQVRQDINEYDPWNDLPQPHFEDLFGRIVAQNRNDLKDPCLGYSLQKRLGKIAVRADQEGF